MKRKKKNQRGSAILATIMVLGVVLVSALSIAFVTIQNFKASKGASKSTTTYQLADEGVESVMYEIVKGNFDTVSELSNCQSSGKIGSSSLGYEVTLFDKDDNIIDCNSDGSLSISDIKKLKSVGTLEDQSQRSVSAFVPIACNDPTDDENTSLLLHFDGGSDGTSFLDATENHTISDHGGVMISRDEKKFCRSGYFDGDGDYLTVPESNDWDFGTSDFTIDFWINLEELDGTRRIFFNTADLQAEGIMVGVNGSDEWFFSVAKESCAGYWSDSTGSASTGWHHIALERDGNKIKFFVDGSQESSSLDMSGDDVCDSSSDLSIGKKASWDGEDFKGYMDEFRISKDVARWEDDFAPPEYPY